MVHVETTALYSVFLKNCGHVYLKSDSNELHIRAVRYIQSRSNSSSARRALGTERSAPLIPLNLGVEEGKDKCCGLLVVIEKEEFVFKPHVQYASVLQVINYSDLIARNFRNLYL
jgi:hypothetical protein